jgi:ABC-type glutathione transport system ATPase component
MRSWLEVQNLSISYRSKDGQPVTAVNDVSFGIASGETVGLMGQSGCGKSSIALALMGLLPRHQVNVSGSVVFCGSNLLGLSDREFQKLRGASISMVHQEPEIALSPVMRVGKQIAVVVRAHRNLSRNECQAEARAMLARMGFADVDRIFHAYPHQLSGGQRQRIVLAQALVAGPALLIADEPTAHLDARSQSEFLDLLEAIKRASRLSILLISHTPEIQARLADRVLIMQAGQIVERGRIRDLARYPQHAYTRELLGVPWARGGRAETRVAEPVLG